MAKFIQIVVGGPVSPGSAFSIVYALDDEGQVWWYAHGNMEWYRYD